MTNHVTPYLYHAHAYALSAHFTRPFDHLVEVQAGTTLPMSGGHGSSRVENFRFDGFVSFKAGYSQVSGSEKFVRERGEERCIHTTLASSVVEGLNILDMITADRVVSRVAASYESGDEGESVVFGTQFDNLRINGYAIRVELHHDLVLKIKTFAAARELFAKDEEFRKMAESPFGLWKLRPEIEPHGVINCSLVKELTPGKFPGIERVGHYGHVLVVPEFGKIHLAELTMTHGSKTLTMIRVELGSPNGGGVTAGVSGNNGRPPGTH
jgi:hypothetical protein